jgi:hypothetical protein
MERRVGVRFSLHLLQPARTRKADRQCEDYVEGHAETGRSFAFSDLRPAACFLHSTKLRCTGRYNSKGDASYQPRDKAPIQLGMVAQEREAMEKANPQVYGESATIQ